MNPERASQAWAPACVPALRARSLSPNAAAPHRRPRRGDSQPGPARALVLVTTASSHGDAVPTPRRAAVDAPSADHAPADDVALVRAMSSGDEQALGALYDRWSASVRSLAAHVLRAAGADDADAVTEEVFWQAWRQASRYDGSRGTVSAWLLTMTRSRALDRARSRLRSREDARPASDAAFDADAAHDFTQPLEGPAEALEAAERRTLVAAVMRELPAEQREAVKLAYFDGLSQTEIAEHTGQPLGTVKTRIRLALRKLRERLVPLAEGAR